MMASLKLVAAIMVALFAVGLEAKGGRTTTACFDLESEMRQLSPNGEADAEKTFALATSVLESFNPSRVEKGRKLNSALAAVVHRSSCNESSLDIVETIADCNLWASDSMKSLDEATREYARECLTADYIRDRADSLDDEAKSLTKLIDHQFFVDYNSPDMQLYSGTLDGEKFANALTNAILRDPQGDMELIKKYLDGYLQKRLIGPCIKFDLAFNKVATPLWLVRSYLDDYEKLFSSLDESTREQFYRLRFCLNLYDSSIFNPVVQKVADHLKSASA